MMPELGAALAGAVQVLDGLGVRYALVGGLAVSAWAIPRATRDVDLWAEMSDAARPALESALERADFHVPAMEAELERFGVFRAKHRQSGVFVDIFNAVGPLGEAILSRRMQGELGALAVWLASADDLAVLKAFSDRRRDHDDLVALLMHADVDIAYVEDWARRLDASIGSDEVTQRVRAAVETARSPRR